MRCPPDTFSKGVVACTPSVKDIEIEIVENETQPAAIRGSCSIVVDLQKGTDHRPQEEGFWWDSFFNSPILVSGYPILKRPKAIDGLEASFPTIAFLRQLNWSTKEKGDKTVISTYSKVLVPTLATSEVIVWCLLAAPPGINRLSLDDPRIDMLRIRTSKEFLHGKRHIIANPTHVQADVESCGTGGGQAREGSSAGGRSMKTQKKRNQEFNDGGSEDCLKKRKYDVNDGRGED